jgi:hypothetical protein
MKHSNRSSTSRILGAAAVTATTATLGHSGILYTDYSAAPISIDSFEKNIFVDFDTATATSSGVQPGTDMTMFFFYSSEKPAASARNGFDVIGNAGYATKLTYGTSIGSLGGSSAYLEYRNSGPWQGTEGQGYLGFFNSASGARAWLDITYLDSVNTLSLNRVAVNTDGPLLVGQTAAIPEPASAAALAALLAGGTAAFARRRRALAA